MAATQTESPKSDRLFFSARARFLRLDIPKPFSEGDVPRWEATFMLDPSDVRGAAGIKLLLETAAKLAKENYGIVPLAIKKLAVKFIPGTPALDLNNPMNAADDIAVAFVDGDTKEDYVDYAGMFIVPAHNSRLKPAAANRKGLTVQPGEFQYPYDGAYVLGCITIWLQAGKTLALYGKRIGINLRGVQFDYDGDAFTQDVIAAEDEFTALEDEPGVAGEVSSDFD
jgi:hypothetical protein